MNKGPDKNPAIEGIPLNRLAQMDGRAASRMQDLLDREHDFEEYRATTEQALKKREKDLHTEAVRRQQSVDYQEKKSLEMQIQLEKRLEAISAENERIRAEFVKREADFSQKSEELEQEKQKYTEERQASLRERSETYVTKALTSLKIKDDTFHKYSLQWGMAGAAVIALAFILVVVVSFVPYFSPNNSSLKGWEYIVYASLRGLVTIGVALAFSRYAFLFSKQYMQQSLKIADRLLFLR